MNKDETPQRAPIRAADLPELASRVGMQGSQRHAEVGGAACFDIVVAVITSQP